MSLSEEKPLNTLSDLKAEVERLSRELDQASAEKIQSAQYGLSLLEDKEALQQRCDDLEALYESTKHEFDITQQALAKFHTSHKATTKTGIEQEESLLNETAAMEDSLNSQIIDLENETKQLRHELERVIAERDRMLQENLDANKDKEDRKQECKKLRAELREIKFRETRLITDYSELEEENTCLQKQVSALEKSQVDYESLKHEIRRWQEEVELLNSQVEELSNLKKIAEKQMEEALESLQAEREAKYALKKELDQHINRESMYNISNLAYSIRGITDDSNMGSDGEDDLPGLKRLEADIKSNSITDINSPDGKQVDLFSEIHLNELRKLEKSLEQAEKEKMLLTQNLRDSQTQIEKSQGELQLFMARLIQLAAHVDSLHYLRQKMDKDVTIKQDKTLDKLTKIVEQYQQFFLLSSKEIEQLKNDLKELESGLNCSDATLQLRTEVTNLKNKLIDTEQITLELEADIRLLGDFTSEASSSLDIAQNDLQIITDDLAQLYHHVCTVNGETPSRVVLEHEKGMTPSKYILFKFFIYSFNHYVSIKV